MPSFYVFVFMYFMSFMLVMGSEDWFMVWVGLEMNMMSFLILIYRRYSIKVIESCFKYFFIQSLGSAIMISMIYMDYYEMGGIIMLILSYKIGAGPFFYWFPNLCSGLDWVSCYLLMMFQKFLPLVLLSMFSHWILWLIIIISLLVGIMGSFNQSNIKELMAYSSIHHLGWMLILMLKMNYMWLVYLVVYGMVLFGVVILVYKDEIVNMSFMFKSKNKSIFMVGMLSMAGMPPLLGFFLKWMALINIVEISMVYLILLVTASVMMLYIYIRIVYDIMLVSGNMIYMHMGMDNYSTKMELSLLGMNVGMVLGMLLIM